MVEGKTMSDEQQEKAPSKLDHQTGRAQVLVEDISYLMTRVEQHTLSSVAEHGELQEEIHELQRILTDWDTYISIKIAEKVAQHFGEQELNDLAHTIELRVISRLKYGRNPRIEVSPQGGPQK